MPRLADLLGTDFLHRPLFRRAVTHRSAARAHNERLEFLGDAVLQFVTTELLYARFADADEGVLSKLRARLVRGATLSELARTLALGEFLVLGPGEGRGGDVRDSILADALEAVIGALYLERGLAAVRDFVGALFTEPLASLSTGDLRDAKSRLQEYAQARGVGLPIYEVLREHSRDGAKFFEVACKVPALRLASCGSGASKRKAEQCAAESALRCIAGSAADSAAVTVTDA